MGLASSSAARRLDHFHGGSSIAGRLDVARRAVEARFVEAGDVLARSVDGVGRLISSLDSLGQALDTGAVEATTAELKVAAASLAGLPQRHGDRRRMVEQMIGLAEDLRDCVDEMRVAFARRAQLIHGLLNDIPGVTCMVPQGAFYAFPSFEGVLGTTIGGHTPTDTLQLAEVILDQAKVGLAPGSAFGGEGYFRLCFNRRLDQIEEAANRLAEWIGRR